MNIQNNKNTKSMEIKKENIQAAYSAADDNGKAMLKALFSDIDFTDEDKKNRPVTERIKTLEDAILELGEDNILVEEYNMARQIAGYNLKAYLALRIICAALNEGWEPEFTENEWRCNPWHALWAKEELIEKDDDWKQELHLISLDNYKTKYAGFAFSGSSYTPERAFAHFGYYLCLKSAELADYCGKQFINLWADFLLIRK